MRGHVGEVDRDVDDGLVEAQLVQRVADDLAVAPEQEPHRDGHLALGGVVLKGSQQGRQVSGMRSVISHTEFPIPSYGAVFQILFKEFPRLVGRYCSHLQPKQGRGTS